jgi:hypothetical protein
MSRRHLLSLFHPVVLFVRVSISNKKTYKGLETHLRRVSSPFRHQHWALRCVVVIIWWRWHVVVIWWRGRVVGCSESPAIWWWEKKNVVSLLSLWVRDHMVRAQPKGVYKHWLFHRYLFLSLPLNLYIQLYILVYMYIHIYILLLLLL